VALARLRRPQTEWHADTGDEDGARAEREARSWREFEYLMVRLKFRSDESVRSELLNLALELEARYPSPLGYHREREEEANGGGI
jgi:hypothetical protein